MRYGRVAGAIVGGVGVLLLLAAILLLADAWPALPGGEGEHMRGDATMWLVIVILPVTVAGLLSLVVARLAWLGRQGAPGWAGVWTAVALAVAGGFAMAEGNALSSLRRIVFEGGTATLVGAELRVTTPDGGSYFGYLDEPTFWVPLMLGVAASVLVVVLVAWIAALRRERLHGSSLAA